MGGWGTVGVRESGGGLRRCVGCVSEAPPARQFRRPRSSCLRLTARSPRARADANLEQEEQQACVAADRRLHRLPGRHRLCASRNSIILIVRFSGGHAGLSERRAAERLALHAARSSHLAFHAVHSLRPLPTTCVPRPAPLAGACTTRNERKQANFWFCLPEARGGVTMKYRMKGGSWATYTGSLKRIGNWWGSPTWGGALGLPKARHQPHPLAPRHQPHPLALLGCGAHGRPLRAAPHGAGAALGHFAAYGRGARYPPRPLLSRP